MTKFYDYPGVYLITNTKNGKVYVGSSKNIRTRLNQHKSNLKRGVHYNNHLQREYNKYGVEVFTFRAYKKITNLKKLVEEETMVWASYPNRRTYNQANPAATAPGGTLSKETRAKISAGNKGKTISKETRAKLSAVNTGKKATDKTKAKMSQLKSGENHPLYGTNVSENTKDKMRKNTPHAVRVKKINAKTGEVVRIYDSYKQAAADMNCAPPTIAQYVNKKLKNRTIFRGYRFERA